MFPGGWVPRGAGSSCRQRGAASLHLCAAGEDPACVTLQRSFLRLHPEGPGEAACSSHVTAVRRCISRNSALADFHEASRAWRAWRACRACSLHVLRLVQCGTLAARVFCPGCCDLRNVVRPLDALYGTMPNLRTLDRGNGRSESARSWYMYILEKGTGLFKCGLCISTSR